MNEPQIVARFARDTAEHAMTVLHDDGLYRHRIQRKRTAGWRKPAGAVCVTRPSVYGNPFRVGVPYCGPTIRQPDTAAEAVMAFRDWITRDTLHPLMWDRGLIEAHTKLKAALARGDLVGRDLACWCPLVNEQGIRVPCHADVLLELANG